MSTRRPSSTGSPVPEPSRVAGLVLAAGSGRRYGGPKALADTGDGPWVLRALSAMRDVSRRLVVVGAAADEVAAILPSDVEVVDNPDHGTGLGSSLRAGLAAAAADPDTAAVLVLLVDLPDVGRPVVQRILEWIATTADPTTVLARATFGGRPGHPVALGRAHWAGGAAAAIGDTGAQAYLRRHAVGSIDGSDLADGADVDRPPGIR